MKKSFLAKTLLVGLLALTLLVGAFMAVKTVAPHALAAGPITSQSLAPSSGSGGAPGVNAIVVISPTEGAFEFTPYKLYISRDTKGITWVNQTGEDQTIVSDKASISSVTIPAHKSKDISLTHISGQIDFHLKVQYNVPHCIVIKQS